MPDSMLLSVGHDPARAHPATATVLIVTTDEALRVRIQELLARVGRVGLTCLTAGSGRAALEPLSQGRVDLLLIDLPLPDLSGQELLAGQRKTKRPVPFIALVAPGEEGLGLELMRGGAQDCLLKDAHLLKRLPSVVKRAVQRLQQRHQLAAAQEALRQSEARHRALFELASVGMMEGDPQSGRFLRVNETFCQITGYSAQELQAKCFFEITHPEDREADWEAYQRAVRGETHDYRSETRYLRKDGASVWVRVNVFLIRDVRGRPVRSVGVAEDITERKRAEAELKGLKDRLAADLASMNHLHALSMRLLKASGLEAVLEEILEATIALQKADFGNVQLYNRQAEALEIVAQRGFGSEFLECFQAVPPGVGSCGLALQRRQRVIIEDTEADPAYGPCRAAATAAGYRAVQSTPMFSRDGEPLGMLSTHFRQPHRPSERELRLTDLFAGQAAGLIERQRAEEALRRSEERLRRAVQIDTVGVLFFRTDGRITEANDAFLRMSGYSREDLTQGRVRRDELTPPEWMPASLQAVAEFEATGRIRPYQKEYVRKDGARWWGLFAATRIDPDEGVEFVIDISEQKRADERLRASEERLRFAAQAAGFGCYDLDLIAGQAYRSPEYKALFGLRLDDEFRLDADHVPIYVHPDDRALVREATRESRDPQGSGTKDVEYRVLLPDGTVRWLLVRGRTSFEGVGRARRPVRSRGIALDVTGRKQLEQEILEISGREQRRIGHDLHDDLCQRLGGLQLLSGVLEQELAAEGHCQAPQANRILALVQEALERARLLARGLAPVGVEEGGLAMALEGLANTAAQLFHIRCEFHGGLVGLADAGAATHLYRIAQEAITNAVKHGRAKRVVISLTDAGDSFKLQVIDNGRGFGRTKPVAAGMGLRIMKYRAAMLGATLEVQSSPGHGTSVICAFGKHLCSATRSTKPRLRLG